MNNNPSLWYANYRGAVYPVDLHAPPNDSATRGCHMKSLVECCCGKIVQDKRMTDHAAKIIPSMLMWPLMKEALLGHHELAIQCLVAVWRAEHLPLYYLVPPLFTSTQPLVNMAYLKEVVKHGLRYTTNLAHTYLEALKQNTPTRLKHLDLTGFPTAEIIVYFLATHCMLAHNEVRHETIKNMYEQAVKQVNERIPADSEERLLMEPLEPMEHSLPQDCAVTIKLDAFVTSEATHSELCKALKVSSFSNRKLCLIIGRLAIMCLGQSRISILLKQIHPNYLTGLQLQYNSLTALDFVKLSPVLERLVHLQSLDLSCNTILFYQDEEACTAMAQMVSHLPKLTRLDLSNNRLKTRLRRLIENISTPLKYLRLSGCGLTVTDLAFMAHSHHSTQLEELDLSENNLRPCGRQFCDVIGRSRASLCVLEMEDCNFDGNFIHNVSNSLAQLSNLLVLNVAHNTMDIDNQIRLLESVAGTVSLSVFRSSYAYECYSRDQDLEEAQLKEGFMAQLTATVNRLREHIQAKPPSLFICDLDRVLEPV